MLKAGEYSPNNPLVRGERTAGDALLGLGEYERRRNTLRKIRQQQYREYLDQQAKKKQEAKEQAERERREREQRERDREERERELLQDRESYIPDRRHSVRQVQCTPSVHTRDMQIQYVQPGTNNYNNRVDTGVQVDGFSQPLSVAVQTDKAELYQISPPPTLSKCQMTQAERELSPRSVHAWPTHTNHDTHERRRSYGDFDERSCLLKKCDGDKLSSDLRHSYTPSIFDAEAIRLRNIQAEKEAAERRQFYQQELKNQILEQQRIKEERKNREKMLEQAEMRRLEEQLRMLRVAQDKEVEKQQQLNDVIKENNKEYYNKREKLQKGIDMEQQKFIKVTHIDTNKRTNTSQSDNIPTNLPFYYTNIYDGKKDIKKPYTTENTIFSNYDVDTYLRKNLNFKKDKNHFEDENKDNKNAFDRKTLENLITEVKEKRLQSLEKDKILQEKDKILQEKDKILKGKDILKVKEKAFTVLKEKCRPLNDKPSKIFDEIDSLPIPVLRHSPKIQTDGLNNNNMSDAMKKVNEKWQIPAVQKNILKSNNDAGKNISILTQLGSIRRQLQLEQLRLDRLMSKND